MTEQVKNEPVQSLPGIGVDCAERLERNGYSSVSDIREASIGELSEIEGIGFGKVRFLKEFTQ